MISSLMIISINKLQYNGYCVFHLTWFGKLHWNECDWLTCVCVCGVCVCVCVTEQLESFKKHMEAGEMSIQTGEDENDEDLDSGAAHSLTHSLTHHTPHTHTQHPHTHSNTELSLTHSHTHTHTHTCSLTVTHTVSHTHTHTYSHTHAHTHTLNSLSLTQSHTTHTHTHTHTVTTIFVSLVQCVYMFKVKKHIISHMLYIIVAQSFWNGCCDWPNTSSVRL